MFVYPPQKSSQLTTTFAVKDLASLAELWRRHLVRSVMQQANTRRRIQASEKSYVLNYGQLDISDVREY